MGLQHGLPTEPEAEAEPIEPELVDLLGFRWRVPLSWVHNLSGMLALYLDQLDAQTHYIYIYIIFSHIHNNDNFGHIDIKVALIFVGVIGAIHRNVDCPST